MSLFFFLCCGFVSNFILIVFFSFLFFCVFVHSHSSHLYDTLGYDGQSQTIRTSNLKHAVIEEEEDGSKGGVADTGVYSTSLGTNKTAGS